MTPTTDPARLHDMDHLRALAMLVGVFFHAALAYSPAMRPFFPTADRQSSLAVDAVVWGLHLVRMPLFFVVAGFFATLVVAKRGFGGAAGLWRQRLRRIALPLLVAWPLVFMALVAATGWAAQQVQHPSPLLVVVRQAMQSPSPPSSPLSLAHLWFLYYLLIFTVLHWVVRTLELGHVGEWLMRRPPAVLLTAMPLLLVPALASVTAPHPAPEGVLPQFWAVGYYGAFYALGTLLHTDWLARARPLVAWLALACVPGYAAFLWRLGAQTGGGAAPWPLAVLGAALSVWLTVLCMLAARRFLNRPNRWLAYLASSAYWIYLLHLPLLFALQYVLMDWDTAWPIKFALASLGTLAICLLSYQLLVRHTRLRRFVG